MTGIQLSFQIWQLFMIWKQEELLFRCGSIILIALAMYWLFKSESYCCKDLFKALSWRCYFIMCGIQHLSILRHFCSSWNVGKFLRKYHVGRKSHIVIAWYPRLTPKQRAEKSKLKTRKNIKKRNCWKKEGGSNCSQAWSWNHIINHYGGTPLL